MIELSATTAIMLYLCLTLLAILLFWSYHYWGSKAKKIVTSEKELYICEFCHFAYLADMAKTVNQCPQCASYNKQNQFKRRSKES